MIRYVPRHAFFAAVLVGCTLACCGCWDSFFRHPYARNLADYDSYFLVGMDEEKGRVRFTSRRSKGFEAVYVEMFDGRRFKLADLPRDAIAARADHHETYDGDISTLPDETFVMAAGKFSFRDESLDYVSFLTLPRDSKNCFIAAVSLSEQGPYKPLVMTKDEVVEFFGEPLEWNTWVPVTSP